MYSTDTVGTTIYEEKVEQVLDAATAAKMFDDSKDRLADGWEQLLPAPPQRTPKAMPFKPIEDARQPENTEPTAGVAKFSPTELVVRVRRDRGNYLWHHLYEELALVRVQRTAELDRIFKLPELEKTFARSIRGIRQGDSAAEVERLLGEPERIEHTQAVFFQFWHYKSLGVTLHMWGNQVEQVADYFERPLVSPPATKPR